MPKFFEQLLIAEMQGEALESVLRSLKEVVFNNRLNAFAQVAQSCGGTLTTGPDKIAVVRPHT